MSVFADSAAEKQIVRVCGHGRPCPYKFGQTPKLQLPMKRRAFLFAALLAALTRPHLVEAQPLPNAVGSPVASLEIANLSALYWRPNGIFAVSESENANSSVELRSMNDLNGQSLPVRVVQTAHDIWLDANGERALLPGQPNPPSDEEIGPEIWDMLARHPLKAATAALRDRLKQETGRGVANLALSPNGDLVAFVDSTRQVVHFCDALTGRAISQFAVHTVASIKEPTIHTIVFSPDSRELAVCGLGYVCIADAQTGALKRWWRKPLSRVVSAQWSPDGHTLALAYFHIAWFFKPPANIAPIDTPILFLFDANKGKLLHTRSLKRSIMQGVGVVSMAFSPDSRLLACGPVRDKPYILNVQTGQIEQRIPAIHAAPNGQDVFYFVAYAPDGNTLAIASQDKITLYRVR